MDILKAFVLDGKDYNINLVERWKAAVQSD